MADLFASRAYQTLRSHWQIPTLLLVTTLCYRTIATFRKYDQPATRAPRSAQTCRFRLDTDSSATFTLPDGRKLGYAQYGSLTGRPILYLHGLPGSRLEITFMEEAAVKLGARIIAVDRPGFGWSSPDPNRTILDHPKDLEHLAEHLGLQDYGVLGISGGGPYALACAASMPPDKLKAVTIVVGMGLPDMSKKGMSWHNWSGFTLGYLYFPSVTRWWFKRDPATQFHLSDEERLDLIYQQILKSNMNEKDRAFFGDESHLRLYLRSWREALVQGYDAFLQDGRLISLDPGFRIEDIRPDLPIRLWYGKHDTSVPPIHGEETAARLGNGSNVQLRIEDETHASIVANRKEDILRDLVKSME